jgi:hypothetical protein
MATGRVPTTANSPLTAKGDLFGYSTTQARVAVGNDGETLVADSSTSTGLRYQANFAAGKNKIINGDFGVWQRGTSFTVGGNAYTTDRWVAGRDGNGTYTLSQQTFTPGTAPVAGYEGQFFAQIACTSVGTSTYSEFSQPVEDVRTFAGQTVTVSFWARLSAGSVSGAYVRLNQFFGSGGSAQVTGSANTFTPTGSWQRFTMTITLPSIAGKTIGTGSYLTVNTILPTGGATGTVQFWGFQLEAGSVATAFQTATGTIQGELAACQRYYFVAASGNGRMIGSAFAYSGTQVGVVAHTPVQMRTDPTLVATSGTDYYRFYRNSGDDLFNSLTLGTVGNTTFELYNNAQISSTAGQAGMVLTNNASASIAFNAEL